MPVAMKAAKSLDARRCVAAVEASQPHVADDHSSAVVKHQPATFIAGSRGSMPRDGVEPKLEVLYSDESDVSSDWKTRSALSGSPEALPPSLRGHGTLNESMRREIFVLSSKLDNPPSEPSVSHSDRHVERDVGTFIDTMQEDKDRGVLLADPELKPWTLPQHLLDRWSGMTSDSHRIPLFDSSRLHGLDVSATNYGTEHMFFIDVFLKHRWYSANHKREGNALLQAWNAFIHNVECMGREAWIDKLAATRSKFEKRNPTGARYKLHRLSREAGLPCLSWGDSCPSCLNNSNRAPKEAYLLTEPWWRARISPEMREGIATLQSLYKRDRRSFF